MIRAASLAALLLFAGPASAHGLRLTLAAEPGCLSGRVEYSDGWPGEGETVVVRRVDTPAEPHSVVADASGRFNVAATPGRYRVLVSGDEDHQVEREIDLPVGANGRTCSPAGHTNSGKTSP